MDTTHLLADYLTKQYPTRFWVRWYVKLTTLGQVLVCITDCLLSDPVSQSEVLFSETINPPSDRVADVSAWIADTASQIAAKAQQFLET